MKLFADEDFDHRVVARLREFGHDVITAMEVRRRGVTDEEQLAYATAEGRALITFNRSDFHRLHRRGPNHGGIIACTRDGNVERLALHIHNAVANTPVMAGQLVRIVRGSSP